jgi:hypothetical protein
MVQEFQIVCRPQKPREAIEVLVSCKLCAPIMRDGRLETRTFIGEKYLRRHLQMVHMMPVKASIDAFYAAQARAFGDKCLKL